MALTMQGHGGGVLETIVHGVCPHDCYDACGLVVTAQDGRVTAVKGDPDHPITQGFLCFKVNHYRDRLYHPDRLTTPLKRVGPKGSGRFVPVGWDEALDEVAHALKAVIAKHGGEAVLPYTFAGNEGLLSQVLAGRFFQHIGASRLDRTICTAASDAALEWVYGTDFGPDPETLPETRLVVLWGSNPVATNIHEVPLLDEAQRLGAEIWTVDPLRTATASRFNHHVAIRPGADYALAMGLARELLARDAQDKEFISRSVSGYEAYCAAVQAWTRERTLEAAGIAGEQFDRLVEALAAVRPALIRTGWGMQRRRFGAQATWAISALSIILGLPQQVGGGHLVANGGAFKLNPAVMHVDQAPAARHINMVQLGEVLTGPLDPPIDALIVYQSNPAATAPNQARVLEGLLRENLFTVVHEQMLTDTARLADFVFPAAMSVEQLDLYVSYWHRYVQLNRPAVEPLGESVSNNEFFRRLAARMNIVDPVFQESDEMLIRGLLDVRHPWMEGITWEALQQQPVQKVRLDPRVRPFVDTPIPTPTGRLCIEPLPDSPGMPEDRSVAGGEYHLITPSRRETIKSTYGDVASVVKAAEAELLMHPEDAARRGFVEGQWVTVFNKWGETRMRLKPSTVAQIGTVVSYAVRWNESAGGTNVNQLTPPDVSSYGGGATFYDVRVDVR